MTRNKLVSIPWKMPNLDAFDILPADQAEAIVNGQLCRWRAWNGRQFTHKEIIAAGQEFSLANSPIFEQVYQADDLKIYRRKP